MRTELKLSLHYKFMNINSFKKVSLFLVLPLLLSCSNTHQNFKLISGKYYGFSTLYDVRLYDGKQENLDFAKDMINEYNALCDNFHEIPNINNVYSINHSDVPIKIDVKLFELLEKSLSYQKITNGFYNPLMGKLTALWKNCLKDGILPDQDLTLSLANEVQSSTLVLDKENMTAYIDGDAEIDLGGIAKGYSLDLLYENFNDSGVEYYLVNGGDSSIMVGKKPYENNFSVGIKDIPNAYFYASNCFISTSSLFVQGVEINGQYYSHIINPFTGSALTNYDLVIIKGTYESGLFDALSTAFSLMDLETIKTLQNTYNLDVLLYKNEEIVYTSEGMEVLYH